MVSTTDVPADNLWAVLTEDHDGRAADGDDSAIGTAPHSGRLRQTVEEADPPRRLVEVARLPLAKVRTVYEFEPAGRRTRVRVSVRVTGPLGLLWLRTVEDELSDGLAARTARLVERARRMGQAAAAV